MAIVFLVSEELMLQEDALAPINIIELPSSPTNSDGGRGNCQPKGLQGSHVSTFKQEKCCHCQIVMDGPANTQGFQLPRTIL